MREAQRRRSAQSEGRRRQECYLLEARRDLEYGDPEDSVVLVEGDRNLACLRRLPDNFDELDCLPRDEEITAIAAIDLDRVQNMPVGCDDGVLAELEEDAANRLARLVGTRGNENRLERLGPRTSQGITVRTSSADDIQAVVPINQLCSLSNDPTVVAIQLPP